MVLTRWFQRQINKADMLLRLDNRLKQIERSLEEMKTIKEKEMEQPKDGEAEFSRPSPIIIEYLNVEKIEVDRYEQSNNFGALGIKSLEGKLNIGANYGLSDAPVPEKETSLEAMLRKEAIRKYNKNNDAGKTQTNKPPKTTIRPRSGDPSSSL